MSGPSDTQLQLQQEQTDFYREGIQQARTTFGEQQGLLSQMEKIYQPILEKGPSQTGFSDAERTDLNASAIDATARNYGAASKAVGERMAATGGDNPLTSGGEDQLRAEIAESSAGELSREQGQIKAADYAAGERNFSNATSALENATHELNPIGYESAATASGSAAETTAKDINAEENSWIAPVMGAIGGVGSSLISANPKGIFS